MSVSCSTRVYTARTSAVAGIWKKQYWNYTLTFRILFASYGFEAIVQIVRALIWNELFYYLSFRLIKMEYNVSTPYSVQYSNCSKLASYRKSYDFYFETIKQIINSQNWLLRSLFLDLKFCHVAKVHSLDSFIFVSLFFRIHEFCDYWIIYTVYFFEIKWTNVVMKPFPRKLLNNSELNLTEHTKAAIYTPFCHRWCSCIRFKINFTFLEKHSICYWNPDRAKVKANVNDGNILPDSWILLEFWQRYSLIFGFNFQPRKYLVSQKNVNRTQRICSTVN